jgi:hypothetical protein
MEADALKNEVQKQVVEGRQMMRNLSSRSMVDRRHINNNRSVKRRKKKLLHQVDEGMWEQKSR